jgi:hypothetical protein
MSCGHLHPGRTVSIDRCGNQAGPVDFGGHDETATDGGATQTGAARVRPTTTLAALVTAGLLTLASVACSADSTPAEDANRSRPIASVSPKPTTQPTVVRPAPVETPAVVCAKAGAARTSLTTLANMDFDGIAGAQAAITGVQSDLDALRDVVRPAWKGQVTALSKDVAGLGKTVDSLKGREVSPRAWESVRGAATKVSTSAERLRRSLATICPELRGGGTIR